MYQMHFNNGGAEAFGEFIANVSSRVAVSPDAKVLVHVFNDTAQHNASDELVSVLHDKLPGALYVGCSTSGNICDGALVEGELPNSSAIVNVFEDPSTQIEVLQFPLNRDNRMETAEAIRNAVEERPWVKAIEMLTTLIDVGMAEFCDEARLLPEDIVIFGGGALSIETLNMWAGLPYVFSSSGENSGSSIVLALYGGENFHVQTQTIYGWKPLGRTLTITSAEGPVLHELDGKPAFERYRHYLSLENDEHFSEKSILFPLAIDQDGRSVIKAPVSVGEDGSITLTSDLAPYHQTCRIAYGDPGTILRSIRESTEVIQSFEPQGILVYSCAARRMYWGDENISRETLPMQSIAPTAGFYTGGEFARQGGRLLHHNVTIVIAGIREGEPSGAGQEGVSIDATEFTRQMEIVNSLAAFVGVTSEELENAYEQLKVLAMTDGLTGLLNRREIDERISDAIAACEDCPETPPASLVMLDIDDFKKVNDAYGHEAGDEVLKGLGTLLLSLADKAGVGSSGRWGGEEFMVLLPSTTLAEARVFAGQVRNAFAAKDFPLSGRHTVSVGVTQALPGETSDLACQRVDKALYAAKKQGKDCVVAM